MPQLDVTTFPTQLFWLAVTFIALYIAMVSVGLPRVGGILERRRQRIAGDLARAAELKAEAEAVTEAYQRALAAAHETAQATVREMLDRMNEEAAKRQHELAQSLAAETAAAERRILEAKARALADLRGAAVEVARAAAQKVAGIELHPDRAAAAVDGVLKERA